MVIDCPLPVWLLAVLVSLNTAVADQHVVFAVDSTLTADELRATHRVVGDVLQKADARTSVGMIVFDLVVTQVINLQQTTDALRTRVDTSMAAVIADGINGGQSRTSHPAIGIERSIAELQKHDGSASRPLVVLFTDPSRLDATVDEIDRQFQWLSMILLPELEGIEGALLLVTTSGSLENRLVETVLGFSQNQHLSLSARTGIVERIWSPVSSAQEPAVRRVRTDINTHWPVIMAIGLFLGVVLATVIVGGVRRHSRRREAAQPVPQGLRDESEHYLPLDTTRQRHFSRGFQRHNDSAPKTPASGSAATAGNERSSEAPDRGEAVTVVVQPAGKDVDEA